MQQINTTELKEWTESEKKFLLIDVREPAEHEQFNIGGTLIPLGEIMAAQKNISKSIPVVFYCEKGIRSMIAIQRLEALGFDNLYNLTGGMQAWKAD